MKRVPVSRRALIQRINRALQEEREALRVSRPGSRAETSLGEFYVIDVSRNAIVRSDVDLVDLARELKALKPWEALEE